MIVKLLDVSNTLGYISLVRDAVCKTAGVGFDSRVPLFFFSICTISGL